MFGFLSPQALFGLGLLSIPILLHIFKPRKVRQTPFSSLRWLRASQHRLTRRVKWDQVLLFILRAVFLTLLVLALAKPVFSPDTSLGKAERFVVLDVSGSMAYRAGSDPAPIVVGRQIAEQLVSHVITGDRTTIVLAGGNARTLGPLRGDAGIYLPRLRSAQPEHGRAHMGDVLRTIRPMLDSGRTGSGVDLFFITDNQAHNWSQASIAGFLEETSSQVRCTVVDVELASTENAWIADARLIGADAPEFRTIRVRIGAVGRETQERTVRLTGLPGVPDQRERISIPDGDLAQLSFAIPADYELAGKVARLHIEPADALPGDDVFWLNLDSAAAARVLVIEPETTQVEELQPGFHLRMALEALSSDSRGALTIVRRPATGILAPEIGHADVVVMVDVPALSDSTLRALEQHVKTGGGLVVFLGPSIRTEFYNTRMYDPIRPSGSLLPVLVKDLVAGRRPGQGLSRLAQIQWRHPVFASLFDPVYGDLTQTRFRSCYRLDMANMVTGVQVLALIEPDIPAIIERRMGAGKVILFNTTANDAWSDLPRRKSFVPLVDRLLAYLTTGAQCGMFTIGEVVTMPLPDEAHGVTVTVVTPGGSEIEPTMYVISGQSMIRLESLAEPGVYRVEYDGKSGRAGFPFVVQADRVESQPLRVDESTLCSWWQPAQFRIVRPNSVSGTIDLTETRVLLEPWLVATACLMILAEMFFVHRFCPKVNPSVMAGSVVTRHRFFGPDRDAEANGVDRTGV